MAGLPIAKFSLGGLVATEADLCVLKDVISGESIPCLKVGIGATATGF